MNIWKILGFVFGGAVILAVGLLIGHFGIYKETRPKWVKEISQDVDEDFIKEFMKEVNTKNLENNLRELSKKPHMATTEGDEELVRMILDRWNHKDFGLDEAKEMRYDVYLSFPNKTTPNRVRVLSTTDGTPLFESVITEENLHESDQSHADVVTPFAAYSPRGNPQGKLVYAYQGKLSDFEALNRTVDLRGTIAIVRYGGAGRSTKAINAAQFGVIGLIVYTDPRDINDGKKESSETYPNSWYMPPTGVERGSYTQDFGDLLTFSFPAKDYTYRIKESEIKGIPPIPSQPIGFGDAESLICQLGGVPAPSDWQGSLSCTYNLGPGFRAGIYANSDVQVNVYNYAKVVSSANVMGMIRGSVEPDRYVMYGNHRDSWVHGAIDPSSGTSVMLEITRILGTKVKRGRWRPRRTIIFGSWGAEEHGLIGSTEFAEEFYSKLRERTTAYINVDISVFANATLRVQGTPPAQDVVFQAAKEVQTPASASLSVYDNWIRHFNRSSTLHNKIVPLLATLGAGSDYAPFLHYLGITCMDFAYTYDTSKTSARIYPAYHTAYDTFDYTARHIDPGFTSHQAVARTAGNTLLRLADSLILPFGPVDYWDTLQAFYNAADTNMRANLAVNGLSLEPLKHAIDRYKAAAEEFSKIIQEAKDKKEDVPLRIRMINDQLMLLERAFINHHAMEQAYFSHVMWAPRTSTVATFPGLANAYSTAISLQRPEDWEKVHKYLTVAIQAVENAATTLETAAAL